MNSKEVMNYYADGVYLNLGMGCDRHKREEDFRNWLRDTLIEYGRTLEQYWEPDIEEQADNLIKRELS